MRVVIVHNAVAQDATEADQDTLVQVDAVRSALDRLGHEIDVLPCTLNLEALQRSLQTMRPDAVFNLVESFAGSDRLQHFVPALLDAIRVPYTGARSEALFWCVDKLLAKQSLRAAGLPTPDWQTLDRRGNPPPRRSASGAAQESFPRTYIIKTVAEHASFGLDDDLVVSVSDEVELTVRLRQAAERLGRVSFAEQFIEGREFNLSLLTTGSSGCAQVLPPAEIDFSHFPAGKPRVVGYRAKWDAQSFEFHHTPRGFDFPPTDAALLEQLRCLARQCWDLFRLTGYARVDFRVDAAGQPWILEVNVNPCLSHDAGFAAAVQRGGIAYEEALARILADR